MTRLVKHFVIAVLLGLAAPHVSVLGLGACAAAVVITVAVLDYRHGGEPAAG